MCGILGKICYKGKVSVPPQLDLLNHRGPDGRGEWVNASSNVYFGHTRLSILEPTPAGHQPMSDASKRFTITFNGEIYNHHELRSKVPAVNWRGASDTETLLELFATKGLEALPLLKGMFAFAIHDSVDNTVLLVRDRLGIKPLWIRYQNETCSFASEVRVLLEPDEFVPTKQALSEFIGFGRMPLSGEIFVGIGEVPPGGWVKVSCNSGIETGTWWHPTVATSTARQLKNRHEHEHKIKELLTTAIEEHLISDVGVGAFLSGGIDSSIVVMVAGQILGKKLQTFTVGFPQKTLDERSIASKVAKHAGSEHYELEVSEDTCLGWVKEAVLKLDLPSVDAINSYIVSKAVRNTGLKVALSGLGGDELFGGYPSFKNVPFLTCLGLLPKTISQVFVKVMPGKMKEKLYGIPDFSPAELTTARRRFTSVKRLRGMNLEGTFPSIPVMPAGLDTMGAISWAEMYSYMIPMLLRDSDQMSMAVGLEIRVPFLDHLLVEEVLSIPQRFKKGSGVKSLLVDAFRTDLPPEVYERPKQGFALPMEEWIRGPLAEFMDEGILAASDLLGLAEPLRLKEKFVAGSLHWTRVWLWCVLGHWLTKHVAASKYQLSTHLLVK
ncbi:asparagine synthase (glutamine-hydrolyzing) [Pontibacter saemangeumensis]|uniref:asparagine synthase (glutamine-hydrolyzing) n=1 Tax=Pontibacter saemangeumensis TaxID=1084525 RepID=A0ABP8M0K5_9BACT